MGRAPRFWFSSAVVRTHSGYSASSGPSGRRPGVFSWITWFIRACLAMRLRGNRVEPITTNNRSPAYGIRKMASNHASATDGRR